MTELLPYSIGIGLAVGLMFTEMLGIASGGLIVPGYFALYLTNPTAVGITLGVGLATFGVVKALSTVVIIYGRRRTALAILVGYVLGMLVRGWTENVTDEFAVIGFIIPGLIAIWMDRQGVLQTLASLVTTSVVVRLILVLAVGMDLPR